MEPLMEDYIHKRAKDYQPWTGKRSPEGYQPWLGKRSGGNRDYQWDRLKKEHNYQWSRMRRNQYQWGRL